MKDAYKAIKTYGASWVILHGGAAKKGELRSQKISYISLCIKNRKDTTMDTRVIKRLAILIVTICVLLIMAVPSFATSGAGAYEIGTPTQYSNKIKVKLVIQSRSSGSNYSSSSYINIEEDVELGVNNQSGQTFTVRDVINKFNTMNVGVTACDASGTAISTSSPSTVDNVYMFKLGNTQFAPIFASNHGQGKILCDGWKFRVNGKYPLESWTGDIPSGGPKGAMFNDVPVDDGDVVHFYTDYPWVESGVLNSSAFMSSNTTYSNGVVSAQLNYSYSYFDDYSNNYYWNIASFANYSGASSGTFTGVVYDTSGTSQGTVSISNTTGSGSANISLAPGTYYLVVPTTGYKQISGKNWSGTSISRWCINTTIVYDKFVVSSNN